MNDTRLTSSQLEAAVDFAYGGGAVRAGRKAQARALSSVFRSKAAAAKEAKAPIAKA